jgi:hypothetical protein
MGLWGDIEHGFSAVIGGVEHIAGDIGSLVDKALNELETLGIGASAAISWLVKFLIEAGEDPVAVISQLSGRISSLGGDPFSTLEQLAEGIMTYGLTGFAQKKVNEALAPLRDTLSKSTAQSQAIANVHQTTLSTMKIRLDALQTGGNTTAWQGLSVQAMNTSFDNISVTLNSLTAPMDAGGAQAALNYACEQALQDILVVGEVVLVCEIIVTAILTVAGLAADGVGALVGLGAGVELMEATLELLMFLIGADLAIWLLGTIAIYVVDHTILARPSTTGIPNNGPQGVNVTYAHESDLPINPGQVVPGGRIYIPPKWSHGKPARARGGFVDAKGNIWEWAPGGAQHGGPHWDVQHPDGSHTNVAPNGKVIGKDNFPNNDSLKK